MEYEIVWGGDPEDILVETSGIATTEGILGWTSEVLDDPRYRPGMRILVDHRNVDWREMRPEDIERRIELIAPSGERFGLVYIAFVTERRVDFGLLRMQQQYAEAQPELKAEMRVFQSLEEARNWLATVPSPTLEDSC
jgi:hypothetical protein